MTVASIVFQTIFSSGKGPSATANIKSQFILQVICFLFFDFFNNAFCQMAKLMSITKLRTFTFYVRKTFKNNKNTIYLSIIYTKDHKDPLFRGRISVSS